jgi:hypothetical protein
MPAKVITFREHRFTNPYKRILKNFERDAQDLPLAEAAFIRRRARSIMRKGPQNPKTRFGNLQAYSKRSQKYGKYYWRKGMYSRPGHPPFYHTKGFNLRTIWFGPIQTSDVSIPRARGQKVTAYRVGPKYNAGKFRRTTPVPALHEFGGVVHVKKRGATFKTRVPGIRFRRKNNGNGTLNYPARPYMKPAAAEARVSVKAKKGGSLPRLVKLGGLKGRRFY